VFLQRGNHVVKSAEVGCYTSHVRCGKTARIAYRVTSQGVYHVLVMGQGAENIRFALDVRGYVYPPG
jgi:hypothetical protein